jgi:hypothetical protein
MMTRRRPRPVIVGLIVTAAVVVVLALYRAGLLDLPPVPPGTTLESSGLAGLDSLAQEAATLSRRLQSDDERSLAELRAALLAAPADLVIGNAYRMMVLRLVSQHLAAAAATGELVPNLPSYLEGEPTATLDRLRREHPSREATLQLALARVDEMLLYPALEIKAPASVESVELLTQIVEGSDPSYVPALYARGLNYLHRPARLVWPEERKAAPDAASRDLGTAVAIGRHLEVGSPRLRATLGLALGDAYAKEGRGAVARSWWQIARAASADTAIRAAADRRFGWEDRELLDRLETELEARMLDLDPPMTDLSIMWSAGQ